MNDIPALATDQPPFARLLGVEIIAATPDRVEARIRVRQDLANRNGVLHGGAIMGIADNLGGTATFLNLGEGQGTVTVESKTSFFRPVSLGSTLSAVAEPLHRGRKTMVWQTTLLREDGKVAAIVTQTQMVLRPEDR